MSGFLQAKHDQILTDLESNRRAIKRSEEATSAALKLFFETRAEMLGLAEARDE